jgi:hypothetical protein
MIKVHGCGCRYRDLECDHLCDKHKDEFILTLYNQNKKEEEQTLQTLAIWKDRIDKEKERTERWIKWLEDYQKHSKKKKTSE